MSLMRLLAVGRSIATINNQPSRYRMTQQNLLPKFASPDRPGPEARELTAPSPAPERTTMKLSRSTSKSITTRKEEMNREESGQVAANKQSASPDVPRPAFPLGRWSVIRNPFGSTRKVEMPPVQGELSLDMVKPVRNDLNDADLEIVLARKQPVKSEPKPATVVAEKHEPVGYLWSRLSSRLFRTEQS